MPSGDHDDAEDFLAHAEDLRRLARSLVSDPHAADDLVQDAWVEVLEGRARPSDARERTSWLAGLMRNLKRERSRGEGRRANRDRSSARPESVAGEQAIVERMETFRMLAAEVARLDEPYRSSLWQRFFEGRTAEEIAAREGVAAATIRARWMRALTRLRERLDQRHGGDRSEWLSALLAVAAPRPVSRGAVPRGAFLAGAVAVVGIVALWWTVAHGAATSSALQRPTELAVVDPSVDAGSGPAPESIPSSGELEPERDVGLPSAARTAPLREAPLNLRFVDLWSGAGIPACWVRVRSATGTRDWLTDRDGRLRTDAIVCGDIGLEVLDDRDAPQGSLRGEAREFRRARPFVHADGLEHDLIVPVGPTYELELEMPLDFAPGADPLGLRASLCVNTAIAAPSGAVAARSSARARVRAADASATRHATRPWVRFGPDARALAGAGPWTLRVLTDDGRWGGEARIDSVTAERVDPVGIRLTERCVLDLRILDAVGRPVDAYLEVLRADGARIPGEVGPHSACRIEAVEAGRVRIRARALGRDPIERDVDVVGPIAQADIVFPVVPIGGAIAGTVHANGALARDIELVLRDGDGGELRQRTQQLDESGVQRSFRFDDVPAGSYELRAESPHVWTFEPGVLHVAPPAVGLDLLAVDTSDGRPVIVKARDARTGARIEHFDARLSVVGGAALERATSIAAVTFPDVPRAARVAWTVAAPGWVPAHGDERALRSEPDRFSLEIVLERGAELRVRVIDHATDAPLSGVAVWADGVERGRTDARGEITLRLGSSPRRLGATLAGWRTAGGGIDPATGSWSARELDLVVCRMERASADAGAR
jgi:RNA polymerase sigma-70 factor (ECF subfamily)